MSEPAQPVLVSGRKVAALRFTLVRALGRGGMGEVWLAQDERLNEPVALKFLPPEVRADPVALDDLRRETARSHRLTHPNIVRIHDLHEEPGGMAFIAMEYVDGPTLAGLRLEQPERVLSWEFLRPLVQQLCAALDYAHGEKVIHRDLKPANVMVDDKGRLKLADFGIAATVSDSVGRVSGRHNTSGTLPYMSPQQLAGKHPQVADDIYALGATLYELLTSKPPFYTGDITHQVLHEAPEPPDERLAALGLVNAVPRDVAALIMACLAKEPAQRPQSARAVAEWIGLEVVTKPSLESLTGDVFSSAQAGEATPDTSDLAVAAPAARSGRQALWAGSVVFVLLVLLAAGGWYWTTHESAGKRPSAPAQTASVEPSGAPASLSAGGSLPKSASQLTAQHQEPAAPSPPASAEPKVTLPPGAAQPPAPFPLVGTWEFVSAKTPDGKENQAYVKAFKDKRYIKMITPTHFICVTIDPTTGKITGAHGGPCLLGNGEFTDWPQYGTALSSVPGAKGNHFKVRFEGDKFVQSFEDGNEETWQRAKAADVTATAPGPGTEQAITFPLVGTWEFVSAKTADGRENQGYIKALKDKQYIKMITPTHSIVLTIDPASGKITGAHGGACLLGNGEFTEWPQYDTDSSKVRAKSFRLKVRFEGDKLVQSFEDGSEQTWRRAEAADVTTAPSPPASAEPKVTPPAGMAKIPAGSFTMGDANDGNPDGDAPLHTVYVSAFYMDTNLVAYSFWCDVYQWAANHGYNFDNPGSGKAAKHPVQQVNWYDGVKWCNARSEKEGRTPAYYTDATHATVYRSGRNDLASSFVNWNSGYRLPTEAEWEKAARGGVSGQRFPWGNTINWSHANYRANPDKYSYDANRTSGFAPKFNNGPGPHTSPVGCFAPNGYGLYDMAGNLFEQCWDWYGSYESSGQSDPRGPASGTNRTYRGGSWSNLGAYNCRTAIRTHDGPANKWGSQGFRCVLPAGQP